jgi:hypothetical protein
LKKSALSGERPGIGLGKPPNQRVFGTRLGAKVGAKGVFNRLGFSEKLDFRFTDFSEVRISPVLQLWSGAHILFATAGDKVVLVGIVFVPSFTAIELVTVPAVIGFV